MEPLPTGSGRSARLALVAVGLLALLAVVAFASRSGFGHQSQAKPTPGYVSYAFTAFLIVFVLAIPVAMYSFVIQAREGQVARKSFTSRVLQNIAMMLFFGIVAFVVIYLKQHHHHIFNFNPNALKNSSKALHHKTGGKAVPYEPKFEWGVFWVALVVGLASGGYVFYRWRTRTRRPFIPLDLQPTVAEDFAQSMSDAIGDLEAEPDARRAVIAAYARMEAVLARHGLRRKPSETPVEYLRRVLLGLTTRTDAVQRLTALFEEAKFSRHEITGAMKQEAIGALRAIRDDLQREAA
jgi:hypothetical protein